LDDRWRLSQILAWQARAAIFMGEPIAAREVGQEGRDLADAIGDRYGLRQCRWCLGTAQLWEGDPAGAAAQFRAVADEAGAAHDGFFEAYGLSSLSTVLAWQGHAGAARAAADAAIEAAAEVGGFAAGVAYLGLTAASFAAGDATAALDASEAAWQHVSSVPAMAGAGRAFRAEAALAGGDLVAARREVDEAASTTAGWWLMLALTTRARVAIAEGEAAQAERDAYDALALVADVEAHLSTPDILESLAALVADRGNHREATRLFGAAQGIRQRMGVVRPKIWDAGYEASVAALRDALGKKDFESALVEGAALSTEEAIAYAQRGRGERKRPASGWASLTPAERDVVRLVSEGLGNNDIATRLFVSPRTVQSHLTHVYAKLGLSSRVQLAQEAARHG
jgi:DNA-binding CsgD family transcriptional regulator